MPVDVPEEEVAAAAAAWERQALLLAGAATDFAVRQAWDNAFAEVGGFRPGNFDPEAQQFMRRFHFLSIQKLTGEQRENIRRSLLDSVRDGLGQDDAARALGDVFDASKHRLRMISRTELNRASSWGRLQGFVASGVVQEVEWVATFDDRVRPDHLASDGNRARPGEPFTGPGVSAGLLTPPGGVMCRCTTAPVTDLFASARAAKAKPIGERGRPAFEDVHPFIRSLTEELEDDYEQAWDQFLARVTELVLR